jgi:hypothetical protein
VAGEGAAFGRASTGVETIVPTTGPAEALAGEEGTPGTSAEGNAEPEVGGSEATPLGVP